MSFIRRHPLLCAVMAGIILLAAFPLWLLANARAMPVVRQAEFALPWPADAPRTPVTIALISDTHMSGPDNSPERMARIVDRVNALRPDIVVLGGDYIGDDKGAGTYNAYAAIAPFARLHAPLGVVAVLGNHDAHSRHNRVALRARDWTRAFARIGVTLLQDQAVRRGPLAFAGLKDIGTRKADLGGTLATMRRLGGAPIILSHGPDILPRLPDTPSLTLVGHTHCGQVALPFIGPVYVPSNHGVRFACGEYRLGHRRMIVGAGIGTSGLPIRMFAPPEIWLITLRPA